MLGVPSVFTGDGGSKPLVVSKQNDQDLGLRDGDFIPVDTQQVHKCLVKQ